jgi:hypothetical protein
MRQLLYFIAVTVALTDGDLVRLFRIALRLAKCEEKEAYTDMEMSQSQFSKQMNGDEPPRFLSRIHRIKNREVAKCYFFELSALTGPPSHIRRALPLQLALIAQKRMARASLQTRRILEKRVS